MKRTLSILLTIVMVLSLLTACGGEKKVEPAKPDNSTAVAPTTAEKGKYLLRIATVVADIQPYCGVLYDLEKTVEEKTNGVVEVEIYPNAQLGGEEDIVRKTMTGTIEACISSVSSLASYKPEFNIMYGPFLYTTREITDKVRTNDLTKKLIDLSDLGMTMVGLTTSGGTTISTKKEIKSVEEMKDLKLRSPALEAYLNIYKALGMNPTPIPYNEVFTAVQQGTVDGMENGLATLIAGNYQEAGIKYVWATNQIFGWMAYMVSNNWWKTIPAEYQTIIQEAFDVASKDAFNKTWDVDEAAIKANDPFICHVPSTDELQAMQKLTADVVGGYIPVTEKKMGAEFVDEWFKMIGYQR